MDTNSLNTCLQNLLHEHNELLKIAEKKKQVLISGAIQELHSLAAQESKRIQVVKILEQERQSLIQELLLTKGQVHQNLSFRECLQLLGDPNERQKLNALREQLWETVCQLKDVNELNQQLIQQSLSFVQYSMELVTEGHGRQTTYVHPKHRQVPVSQTYRFFESKA